MNMEVLKCSKCGKEGRGENIGICGFVSNGNNCDKVICFDCGHGCVEECGAVRCCVEHAEKCRECGEAYSVRCGQCQRQMLNDKESKCIDCIDEMYPEFRNGGVFDYERVAEV